MTDSLAEYFRCPERFIRYKKKEPLSVESGYFQFGEGATCFGNYSGQLPAKDASGELHDARKDITSEGETIYLPFDPEQIVNNLRCEVYVGDWRAKLPTSALAKAYYFVRPILPVGVRRHLQKAHLKVRSELSFPRWPIDCSVDNLMGQLLLLTLKMGNSEQIPFIWFWPEGASSCAIMTHDVETALGRDFCSTLMDIDDSYGIKASYQIVPEDRYVVSGDFLDSIRSRGCEIAVHDLNHDGHLYRNHQQFLERAVKINSYAEKYRAEGFRAGVLYRKQLWYDALKFSFDMSVPNVGHWDPQRGGCCTVMPYFLGSILEIPVTATQDYTLFHILNDYSIDLWKQQIAGIMAKNGLLSFIIHPDYIVNQKERNIYEELLGYLVQLREKKGVWTTTPGEVNRWWRQRSQMKLVEQDGKWQIEGPGKERARIAYAAQEHGQLVFRFQG
ncbi:MAG: hypothetical protein PVS2B2_28080 [Candidatus Acidiferrum sp.]